MPTRIQTVSSIVVVEDPLVTRLVHSVLGRRGYDVSEASPHVALELLSRPDSPVSLIVTNTPGIFLRFADRVRLLYMAASPDYNLAGRFQSCRVLHKPFHPAELVSAVASLLS